MDDVRLGAHVGTAWRGERGQIVVPVRSRGVGRVARVEVLADGPTLPYWLSSGVHIGVAIERVQHRILHAIVELEH